MVPTPCSYITRAEEPYFEERKYMGMYVGHTIRKSLKKAPEDLTSSYWPPPLLSAE
jgi:hypothetical protein